MNFNWSMVVGKFAHADEQGEEAKTQQDTIRG